MIVTIKQNNVTIGIINVTDFFLRYHKSHNRYHKCHRSFFRSILKSLVNRQFQGGGLDKKKEDKIILKILSCLKYIKTNKQEGNFFVISTLNVIGKFFFHACFIRIFSLLAIPFPVQLSLVRSSLIRKW